VKLITRETDYAIRALCCMAKQKVDVTSVYELAKCLDIPRPFLRKILQVLNKKKVLCSYKGKGGGFKLSIKPKELSLYDIITAFQGPVTLNDHMFKRSPCPHISSCHIKRKVDVIEKLVISRFKSVTIASIIEQK